MNETTRIAKLFDNLFDGDPWVDVTLMKTLSEISPDKAAFKSGEANSIWEIANHIISWRRNVLKRVIGEAIATPEHNYFLPVEDTSARAWQNTLKELSDSQSEWTSFLNNMNDSDLQSIHPINKITHYEHIHGIIQHDAYHLGQIVLLAKHFVNF